MLTFGAAIDVAGDRAARRQRGHREVDRIDVFDEARAEQLEEQIVDLVAAGADEAEVRALVRDAQRLRA